MEGEVVPAPLDTGLKAPTLEPAAAPRASCWRSPHIGNYSVSVMGTGMFTIPSNSVYV